MVEHPSNGVLNEFTRKITDLQFDRNPLTVEVIVVFNDVHRDHYQDAFFSELCRVKKRAIVKKNPDMSYVQQLIDDELLEDSDAIPWLVSLTVTGFPRLPRQDDMICINGIKYSISSVRPVNRSIDSVINMTIYPERTFQEEKLQILNFEVKTSTSGRLYLDILYSGFPEKIIFKTGSHIVSELPFSSYIFIPPITGARLTFTLVDKQGHEVTANVYG